jgi:cytochrome c553
MKAVFRSLLPVTAILCSGVPSRSADFEKDIRPVLEARCFDCHGEDKQKNGLRLDTVHGILKGSDSGEPLYLRGSSADSLIVRMVTSDDPKHMMPPKGERLAPEQVAALRAWIDAGAPLQGEKEAAASLQLKTDHWSFQPVRRPVPPAVPGAQARTEIDAFLLAAMRDKGLTPSGEADRRTLVRRLYLVMHGMPPTPEQTEAFVTDGRPDAWEQLVKDVLASPRRGERWARHWMDVVRYADTNGFETNRERKTAYHYRDWLIRAFNEDMPYDQFVRAQLAGDVMGADPATGFLVAGAYDIVKSPDPNLSLMQRQDELADIVNTAGTAFMGLTMGCARCHNHKFDPILQKDYYAMQAVFAGVNHGERPIRQTLSPAQENELATLRTTQASLQLELAALRRLADQPVATAQGLRRPSVNPRENEEVFAPVEAERVRFTINACTGSQPCLDELEIYDTAGRNVALAAGGAKVTASGSLAGYPIHKLEHINDGLAGNDHSWISDTEGSGWVEITLSARTTISRIVWGRDRQGRFADRTATDYRIEAAVGTDAGKLLASSADREPLKGQEAPDAWLQRLSAEDAAKARDLLSRQQQADQAIAALSGGQSAWIGTFQQPPKTHRLYRGEPMQPREVVAPDILSVMGSLQLPVDTPEQERRTKFAEWITSPQHPLTARVMVNRIWHYIFGTGLVNTPSDFGLNGARPTHPELLDWLAEEFVRSGWSVKHVQGLILQSDAFRRDSAPRPDALKVDGDAVYLWRFPPRRLEAEAIRDAMLTVSGSLDLTQQGGPGFYLMDVVEENVMHYFAKEKFTTAEFRRMVYQFRIRQTTDSVFSSFDCPDGGQVMPKRSRSNTPLQALNLFNSSFVLQQSELLAERLRTEAGNDPAAQTDRAFRLFFNRPPDEWEREQSAAMIAREGLNSFCRALYNASEFLFVF